MACVHYRFSATHQPNQHFLAWFAPAFTISPSSFSFDTLPLIPPIISLIREREEETESNHFEQQSGKSLDLQLSTYGRSLSLYLSGPTGAADDWIISRSERSYRKKKPHFPLHDSWAGSEGGVGSRVALFLEFLDWPNLSYKLPLLHVRVHCAFPSPRYYLSSWRALCCTATG